MGLNPRWSARDASSGARFYLRPAAELAAMDGEALANRIRWIRTMLAPDAGGMTYARTNERLIAMAERRQLENELDRRLNEQPTRRKG